MEQAEELRELAKVQEQQAEEQREQADRINANKAESAKMFAELVTGMAERDVEREMKQDEWMKHQPPPQKKPHKAKEPETPEGLAKKKQQKELDTATTKMNKATETLKQDTAVEELLKAGAVDRKPVKRALDAATKKREKAEINLAHAKAS